MKILLLGKNGQVGSELKRTLPPLGEVVAIGRSDLDLTNLLSLKQLLKDQRPDVIVNAAAYTFVDEAERFPEAAFIINEQVVSVLAEYAKYSAALLIHYSTDYVFDGEKTEAYLETDSANPLNSYGATKLAGEKVLIQNNCNFLIFRTSWLFSVFGTNFIKTILKLAQEHTSLRIIADQYGAPTSAKLIADVTALSIAAYQSGRISKGIYHVTSSGVTNWYDLAHYVVQKTISKKIALKVSVDQIHPITTEEYPLSARRPKNSTLNTSLLSSALNHPLPDWHIDVDLMINQLIDTGFFI